MTNITIQKQVKPLVDILMSEIIEYFKNNHKLSTFELKEKWDEFKEFDAKRIITEVTFTCIENEGIDLNNIKKEDFVKVCLILQLYPQNIEKVLNQNYIEFIHKLVNGIKHT